MKFKRNYNILLSLLLIIVSWLMIGIGYTIKIGQLINNLLFVIGIVFFLLTVNSKN